MASWSIPPEQVKAILIETLRKTVQVSYSKFMDRLIQATPKITGQLKNNWVTSLNGGSAELRPGGSSQGEASYTQAAEILAKYQLGDMISLRNNLVYAPIIEYDGKPHWQAPDGMLRITAAQWPDIVTDSFKRVRSGVINATS